MKRIAKNTVTAKPAKSNKGKGKGKSETQSPAIAASGANVSPETQGQPAQPEKVEPATGEVESTREEQKQDETRANNVPGSTPPVNPDEIEIPDELTTTPESNAWNRNDTNLRERIVIGEESCVLSRFEYVPVKGDGPFRDYSRLVCSDNNLPVGKPFAGSYGLVNNSDFLGIVQEIVSAIEKLGHKAEIVTSGTLMQRERSFISIRIIGEVTEIEGRVIHAFLNCLNSIPSNAGCTVTFANNTFCVCCRNTFSHCLTDCENAPFHAAVKHTKNAKAILKDIPVLVELHLSNNAKLFKQLKSFSVIPFTATQAEQFFAAFIGRSLKGELTDKTELSTRSGNIIDTLKGLFAKGKGNKGETALDVFQAVTEYYTHMSAGESDNPNKQIQSSEAGAGMIAKRTFYSWLVGATQDKAKWQAIAKVGDTLMIAYNKSKVDKAQAK